MRSIWPTYLDLWHREKSPAHIERLADVVEIIMGAFRGEVFFNQVSDAVETAALPRFFDVFIRVCRLVHHLDARLRTSYLKYKREHVCKLDFLSELEFSTEWTSGSSSKGLLLHGLLHAALQLD